jgi:hypothetical protein
MPASYKIRIDTDAFYDIKDAAKWYENKSPGLGKRYTTQVKKDINSLKKNPLLFAVKYKDVLCLKVKKFPFLIHFKVEGQEVFVFAIIHTSQNPTIWDLRS